MHCPLLRLTHLTQVSMRTRAVEDCIVLFLKCIRAYQAARLIQSVLWRCRPGKKKNNKTTCVIVRSMRMVPPCLCELWILCHLLSLFFDHISKFLFPSSFRGQSGSNSLCLSPVSVAFSTKAKTRGCIPTHLPLDNIPVCRKLVSNLHLSGVKLR